MDNAAPRTVRSEKSIEAQERMKRLAQKPKEAVKQLEQGPKCVRSFIAGDADGRSPRPQR
jgi:hypothetical protein